jgi:hypothetical protein
MLEFDPDQTQRKLDLKILLPQTMRNLSPVEVLLSSPSCLHLSLPVILLPFDTYYQYNKPAMVDCIPFTPRHEKKAGLPGATSTVMCSD